MINLVMWDFNLSLIGIILRWGFLIWELIFIYCRLFVLILVVFVLFLLSLRFGQISPLAFFWWFLLRPRIGMLSLVTISPIITAFHSCCLSHHVLWDFNYQIKGFLAYCKWIYIISLFDIYFLNFCCINFGMCCKRYITSKESQDIKLMIDRNTFKRVEQKSQDDQRRNWNVG